MESSVHAKLPSAPCQSVCNKNMLHGANCVRVNNQLTYYRTLGKGKPVMIFASGTGFPADGWFESGIANEMAKKTRVFV